MVMQIGNIGFIPTFADKQLIKAGVTPNVKTDPAQIHKPTGGGNGQITQKVTPQTQQLDWIKAVGSFFPPVKLLDIGRQPVGTPLPPKVETTGSPAAMASYAALAPTPTPAADVDPFGGALKGLSSGLSIAGMAIPIMIGIMMLTKVKGLFN